RDNLWRMFAVWATLRGIKLPDWPYFQNTPTRKIKGRFDELSKVRIYRESIPDWLDELGASELGETIWAKEIASLNQQADVILRVNTLKITREQLQNELYDTGIETETLKDYPEALKLKERTNVFLTEQFKNGLFEVQDASSQLVAEFLEVAPGMRIADACAGAGGKALHLAALMQNKGQIIAMDIYANKLNELKRRAKRNGAFNIETRHIDSTKVIKKLYDKMDRVLIDAPCSGLGILRRNPDAKWKLQPEFLNSVRATQQDILQQYSKMVKPGGQMVYATCSVLPSENQKQIERFLASTSGKEFTFVKDKKILSHVSGYDGFYMALLKKNNN
ncbi:MAG TPA: RsmB/NOP family class I SAM-dependent RNA methyltransferase, partial [Aquaticitalea sp.]|nr:RsmB/NOP family class I SAM-dependent RNA methyltransferase [Aquaticitalea sp.]